MLAVWNVVQNWLSLHNTPDRTVILLKDLIAFRKKASCIVSSAVTKRSEAASGFMKVYYHNKGIEMLHILNSKIVRDNVPMFRKPPMVSYTYTNIVSDWIFNQRRVVEELDFDIGTGDMYCECSTNCYESAGHVVTGDLSISSSR